MVGRYRKGSRAEKSAVLDHLCQLNGWHRDHPVVGDLSLAYEVMELSADTGLTLTAYSPEPNSASQDGLALLASWAATQDQKDQDETAHPADR
jgi:MmyB-like transcription regulator ligand binding domain